MIRITIDDALREKLCKHRDRVQLCDEAGHIIGEFLPAVHGSMYEGVDSPLSPEELARRERETEIYTTSEVLERLKDL
jgi:hypothetical protein